MLDKLVKREIAEALSKERAFLHLSGLDEVTEQQNRAGGYDFTLTVKIELKSAKWRSREDKKNGLSPDYEHITIELKNTAGGEGWLYKEADWFVFELETQYLVVKRTDVVELVDNLDLVMSPTPDLYKMYRRAGRNDITIIVQVTDIESLKSAFKVPKP